jgi:phosphopentomutase
VRALLLVLDSVGIGNAPDAASYGDEGSNTLAHILERVPKLKLPNLFSLGLSEILGGTCFGTSLSESGRSEKVGCAEARPSERMKYRASYGRMQERSAGKDTTTGHWEIAGVILDKPFAVYERFPEPLVEAIEAEAGTHFIGNYACSGTAILEKLGREHLKTGYPILYTSADSVMQIAAHESVMSVNKLYEICCIARRVADSFRIGRIIARPFGGEPGKFVRTTDRRDFSMRPPRTILDAIRDSGVSVIAVGKIGDIFAHQGITISIPTTTNTNGMAKISEWWETAGDWLIFVNLVDFDMLHGHRRDVSGYARALEEFDRWLGEFLHAVRPEDLVIITADHGNDPTYRGSDHTREQVPLFVIPHRKARNLGTRSTFADLAATLADFFKLPRPWPIGSSFLN